MASLQATLRSLRCAYFHCKAVGRCPAGPTVEAAAYEDRASGQKMVKTRKGCKKREISTSCSLCLLGAVWLNSPLCAVSKSCTNRQAPGVPKTPSPVVDLHLAPMETADRGVYCGFSTTNTSVIRIKLAIDAAFCNARRVTLTGSTTPAATRSRYSSV